MSDAKQRLESLTEELAAIESALAEVPPGDFSRRIDLRERRRELQGEINKARRALPIDRGALAAELRALRERRDRLAGKRIDVVSQAGGGSAGGDFAFATDAWKLNRHIDEATGLTDIEARIAEIEERLASTEGGE